MQQKLSRSILTVKRELNVCSDSTLQRVQHRTTVDYTVLQSQESVRSGSLDQIFKSQQRVVHYECVQVCSEVQKRLTHQSPLRLDERPVLTVHLVVEAAGVAEVVAGAVSPPERRGRRAAVHTLSSFCKHRSQDNNTFNNITEGKEFQDAVR